MDAQEQVIEALVFKVMKYGKVVEAVKAMRESGIAGRGREVDGAQTVEVKHQWWVALLDALNGLS